MGIVRMLEMRSLAVIEWVNGEESNTQENQEITCMIRMLFDVRVAYSAVNSNSNNFLAIVEERG